MYLCSTRLDLGLIVRELDRVSDSEVVRPVRGAQREEPAEDGGGTRRGGAAAGAAGPDGGVRSGAAHGHRRLLPHLGPPVQRPLLHRRRPRGAPVRPQTFSPPTSFDFLNLMYSAITEFLFEGIESSLIKLSNF